MLGLPKGEVFLLDYTDDWRLEYQKESKVLTGLIGGYVRGIHHIGSTAVPGLRAKPVIDIAIELHGFESGFECISALSAIGYKHRILAELPDRHYWSKGEPRTHQIHMFGPGSQFLLEVLIFRDKLLFSSTLRDKYQELKLLLCNSHGNEKHEYARAKTDFIQSVLADAHT